ncbi:hypothetical protein CTAYLR_004638 [Chrysophaeum taylorii]|uniref:DUF1995 domain-containing protein n=1 Tax=Chrysophaeum taylorii TaxID=2483200 RepID=A0AAD7UP70_9STRA|nr:hypothetical protein CTAYLR_004638 [Chrysophaeum taylorii]
MGKRFLIIFVGAARALTMKEAANGIRDGMQAALRSRQSRLSVEVPPGAVIALRDEKTPPSDASSEADRVRRGDVALAAFVEKLFPADVTTAVVFVDPVAAKRAKEGTRLPGKKKKKASKKGFGVAETVEWCPSLGLPERRDVVLVVGALSASARAAVSEADRKLGRDTALVLLNSRLPRLTAFPTAEGNLGEQFTAAFSLSPPPRGVDHELFDQLVAYRVFPGDWALALDESSNGGLVGTLKNALFAPKRSGPLWTGKRPPTAEDAMAALGGGERTTKTTY